MSSFTDKTLAQQLHVTPLEIKTRLAALGIDHDVCAMLQKYLPWIQEAAEGIVEEIYEELLSSSEVARLIGDAESLRRTKSSLVHYLCTFFEAKFDEKYVLTRLRVGQVHKRIGVEPKYFMAGVKALCEKLRLRLQRDHDAKPEQILQVVTAIQQCMFFDLSYIFDTYVFSLMEQVEQKKDELAQYAESLEDEVRCRTHELEVLSHTDGLTGLQNRRSFFEELRRELARSTRRKTRLSLLYFDLDAFKKLNDSEGHLRGDVVLMAVAESLGTSLREVDTAARYGGDEFCALLPETDEQGARVVCTRIQAEFALEVGEAPLSMSMGISTTGPDSFESGEELVARADAAMYQAKQTPGNSVCVAD